MKRILVFALTSLLFLGTSSPATYGASTTAGARCSKLGQTTISLGRKFTCIKSGKKLVWNKGILVRAANPVTPAPTQAATPTTTPTDKTNYYSAKDQSTVQLLNATESCSNPKNASFEIQALSGTEWLPVKLVEYGWNVSAASCSNPLLGARTSLAWAKVNIDPGTQYRWIFSGEINMSLESRDSKGRGVSQVNIVPIPAPAPKPTQPLVFISPHKVEGGYGITWDNIANRINDISAAAWTDAQLTIKRNQGLPSALDAFTSYISAGAMRTDPRVSDTLISLKKTFALFQRFPAAQKVFFVALTIPERQETQDKLNSIYSQAQFMNKSIDEMVGINNSLPAASANVWPTDCRGGNIMRNTFLFRAEAEASAVIWIICPDTQNRDLHFEGVQGSSHEYIHTIQFAFKPGTDEGYAGIPCWMREGEPEWGQTAVAPDFSMYLKAQHFHPYLLTSDGLNYQDTTAREWSVSEVATYLTNSSNISTCSLTNQYAYSYSLGAAATEALVSIGGSESIFALHQRLVAKQELNDAFKEIYGIKWEDAVPILAKVVARKISKSWDSDALTYQTRPQA